MPSQSDDGATPSGAVHDAYKEALEARIRRGSLRDLPGLLLNAARMVRSEAPRLGSALLLTQLAAALILVVQLALAQRLVGPLLSGESLPRLLALMVPVVVLVGVLVALTSAQGYLQGLLSEVVTRATWRRVLRTTTTVPLEQFDSPDYFDRLQRIRSNALTRPLQLVQGAISLAGGILGAGALFVSLLVIEPLLAPVLVLFAVPLFFVARIGGRIEYEFALQQTGNFRLRAALFELLTERGAAKEVRAFATADMLVHRVDELYDGYLAASRRKTNRRLRLAMLTAGASILLGAGALTLLVWLVSLDRVALASAGIAVLAVLLFVQRLGRISSGVSAVLETAMFLRDLDAFGDYEELERRALPAVEVRPQLIELRGVSFQYAGAPEPAIRDVDLQISSGQVLALVGANGSGKTTLSKLLADLYRPTTGQIFWDGVDIRELDRSSVGRSVAILFQDFLHYEMSLADNVSIGDPLRMGDETGIRAALSEVRMDRRADELPGGLSTFMSPRFPGGHDLSTGQWQRVAMARALMRDSPLVILDEPTASLDAKAEAELFTTMRTVLRNRTVVLVTHRLASSKDADQIIVMDGGRIVERGTHPQLLAEAGHYATMFELQASAYRAAEGGVGQNDVSPS